MEKEVICQFCDEPLKKTEYLKTTIYSHIENGCEFVTFEYNEIGNLADLVDYLSNGDYSIKRN